MQLIKSFEGNEPYGEAELLQRLAIADEAAFSVVFREYYAVLCAFAQKIIQEAADPEDLVNEVCVKLWNMSQVFEDTRHLKDFLYKSTRNACFDAIKRAIHSKERQAIFLGAQDTWETAADLEMIEGEGHMVLICSAERSAKFIARMAQRVAGAEAKLAPVA